MVKIRVRCLPLVAGLLALTSCATLGVSRVHDPAFTASVSSPGVSESTLIRLDGSLLMGNHVQMDVENLRNITFVQPSPDKNVFVMAGGSLLAQDGDLFHVAGVPSMVRLTDVKLALASDFLLRVEGTGPRVGRCDFVAEDQVLTGSVLVAPESSLKFALTRGSSFSGTINQNAVGGTVEVSIDDTSHWSLTGDAHVTTLIGPLDRVETNGHRLWVGNFQVL